MLAQSSAPCAQRHWLPARADPVNSVCGWWGCDVSTLAWRVANLVGQVAQWRLLHCGAAMCRVIASPMMHSQNSTHSVDASQYDSEFMYTLVPPHALRPAFVYQLASMSVHPPAGLARHTRLVQILAALINVKTRSVKTHLRLPIPARSSCPVST